MKFKDLTFDSGIEFINSFWTGDPLPIGGKDRPELAERLVAEYADCAGLHVSGDPLPAEIVHYVRHIAPDEDVSFTVVGNPVHLYGADTLHRKWRYAKEVDLDSVPYLVIGDESLIAITAHANWPPSSCTVTQDHRVLARSIMQFLVGLCAMHHALSGIQANPTTDDEKGFNLAYEPAAFLFPLMKKLFWKRHWFNWITVFDNATTFRRRRG